MTLRQGSPCPCRANRYIRFLIPAVPGCTPIISCRSYDSTARADIREHAIPAGAEYQVLLPELR